MSCDDSLRAKIPSVARMLEMPAVQAMVATHGHNSVVAGLRQVQSQIREILAEQGSGHGAEIGQEALVARIERVLDARAAPTLRRVFNLTGTVLHTNLGRAPLPQEAIDAMVSVAADPANLEFDLANGKRGDRDSHVASLLCELTGAEAATVVNNNAAAVMLVLNTLANRKEVPVSRGELVEIGGSFRIPDVMLRAGSRLVEVGTTNRTHLADFSAAMGPRTGLVMKVHRSNFAMTGFVASADETELARLAHSNGVPFVTDLGSGTLVDLTELGLPHETTAAECLRRGAAIVTFSGDKLLGGPQAGLILGRADLIKRLNRNPMKRALRLDKITIAGLAAVLRLYRNPGRLRQRLPTLRLLTRAREDIEASALKLLPVLAAAMGPRMHVACVACRSVVGSGALPGNDLPSAGLEVRPIAQRRSARAALNACVAQLRGLPIPVIGRIENDALLLDFRCLEDEATFVAQLDALAETVGARFGSGTAPDTGRAHDGS